MKKWKVNINWRYAIGEFLIVVIGIITAFQLDAWKEDRDSANLVNEYLTDLEAGLRNDSLYYGMASKYFKNIDAQMDSTRHYLKKGVTDLPVSGQTGLRQLSDWYRVYVTNTAFEDLNNSGRLNLIEDKNLRYNLIAYYQYIDFVKLLDEEYNQSLARMQENLLNHLDFDDPEQLKIPEEYVPLLLNYVNQKKSYMSNYLSHRQVCQDINKVIRDRIAAELN